MKSNYILLTALSIGLLAASCIRKPEPVPDPTLDLNFKFSTRSEMTINVSAINEQGAPSSGVLFSIFAENPYNDEDGISSWAGISPIYRGYTESGGNVSVKLSIPNSAEKLYIVPDYAGFGSMVTAGLETANVSVELKGAQLPSTKASMATMAEGDGIERDRINCGNNFHFYTSYISGTDYDPDYGVMNFSSELVSEDAITTEFKNLVNTLFPDNAVNYDSELTNDIIINEDNTEVWLTFIGDGGYTNGSNKALLNSILYYTYNDESELPDLSNDSECRKYLGSSQCQPTYAFINIHPLHMATGTKVQLLYWNGTKYVQNFPAGTKIAFAILLDGYRKEGNIRAFSLKPENLVFSTPKMNYKQHGLPRSFILRAPEYGCCILGMEVGFGGDKDYNDALLKITSSKEIGITNEPVPPVVETEISSTHQGTLAFEDLWPYIGDYDFNDFVTDYKYEFTKVKGTNNISSIKVTVSPRAIGAGENNGFGIEFPFAASALTSEGAVLEEGTTNGTIIVFDNTRSAFGGVSGEINTSPNLPHIEGTPVTFTIAFRSPVAENLIPVSSLNPFLFKTDNRGKEIHLVDHTPTSKADLSLLGTAYDKSYALDGTYYRMDNKYPWALDIANTGSSTWRYPIERVNITSAYLNYSKWVVDHNGNWFDWTVSGNAVESNLY